ncbi:MAG: hypothetical protein NTZ85_02470 [Bacteroidia bacterium]|nr:hypothetical protein [Bacteroidia bacterium]
MKTKKSILITIILSALLFESCNSPKGNYNMNLTLEVSVESILKNLSHYNTYKTFLDALERTKELQKQNQNDYVTLFGRAFQEIDSNQRLAAIFSLAPEMRAHNINFETTNDEVIAALRDEVSKAIDITPLILKTRISRCGLSRNLKKIELIDNRIHVEMSGIDDPERIKKLLTASSKLEFWETYENEELIRNLLLANKLLRDMQITTGTKKVETTEQIFLEDTIIKNESQSQPDFIEKDAINETGLVIQDTAHNPLFRILRPRVDNHGQLWPSCIIGLALGEDTAKVISYLKMDTIRKLFPGNLKFYWSKNPHKYDVSKSLYELHAIKRTTRDGSPILSGNVITSVKSSSNKRSSVVKINLTMNRRGTVTWARVTSNNIGRCIAIVVDDYVRSYPRVMTQIGGGKTQITGDFTIEEAEDLAIILKSGKLPAEIKIVEEQITQGK